MGRKRLSHGIGRRLWVSCGGICQGCGVQTYLPEADEEHRPTNKGPNMATLDHVIPAAKGGRNAHWNLQVLCYRCNMEKAATMPKEYPNVRKN